MAKEGYAGKGIPAAALHNGDEVVSYIPPRESGKETPDGSAAPDPAPLDSLGEAVLQGVKPIDAYGNLPSNERKYSA